jgi:hypothetical protein
LVSSELPCIFGAFLTETAFQIAFNLAGLSPTISVFPGLSRPGSDRWRHPFSSRRVGRQKKRLSFPRRFLEDFACWWCGLAPATLAAIAASAAPTAAIASTSATAIAAATITAAAIATTAAPAWRTRFPRTRFVHGQGPAFNRFAIKLRDGFLRVGLIAHCDKGEAARFAGKLVLHESDFADRADLSEEVLEVCFGGIEGKISYV